MAYPKSHVFRAVQYKLRWRKPPLTKKERRANKANRTHGKTFFPEPKFSPVIYIDPNDPPMEFLNTVVHEGLHACIPDLDEPCVTDTVDTILSLLKRMGMKVTFPEV
jgi:hypothetical protein